MSCCGNVQVYESNSCFMTSRLKWPWEYKKAFWKLTQKLSQWIINQERVTHMTSPHSPLDNGSWFLSQRDSLSANFCLSYVAFHLKSFSYHIAWLLLQCGVKRFSVCLASVSFLFFFSFFLSKALNCKLVFFFFSFLSCYIFSSLFCNYSLCW